MFKILIADDEAFIRKGIISIIQKNIKEEIECIEAQNGIEALEKARTSVLDLVITDINMPGCDGLEFVHCLKKENQAMAVIILSGYENFDYAKRAIKLGVQEYVLKPIKRAEFVEMLERYIRDIKQEKEKNRENNIQKIESKMMIEKLKQDFLVGMLKCQSSKEAKYYLEQLGTLGVNFKTKLYSCAVIEYEVTESNQDYMDFAAKNILDEYLNLQMENLVVNVCYDSGKIAVICEGSNQDELRGPKIQILRKAAGLLKEYCGVKVYVGLGDVAYDSMYLHVSLRHALLTANQKIYEKEDIVSVYDELDKNEMIVLPHLKNSLENISDASIFQVLDGFRKLMGNEGGKKKLTALKEEYDEIQNYISKRLLSGNDSKNMWEDKFKDFSSFWSFKEIKKEIESRTETMKDISQGSGKSNAQLMKLILDYVDEHITEDLDLNLIADKFRRTPGYISTLFKKHVQGGFNSYVTKERMEIAKKLLRESSTPIQEVSELCGYVNAKYFSVVFKKISGSTPREYREKHEK